MRPFMIQRWVVLGVILWCLGAAARPGLTQPHPDELWLLTAKEAMTQQDYRRAITLLGEFVEHFPRSERQDHALYLLVQCHARLQQPDAVQQTVASLRQRFPTSPDLPNALLLQQTTCLGQQDLPRAVAVRQELEAGWPKTKAVWRALTNEYGYRTKRNAAAALEWLAAEGMTSPALAPADALELKTRYVLARGQRDPATLLPAAMELLAAGRGAGQVEELETSIKLVGRIYPMLMKDRRFDEARAIHAQLLVDLRRLNGQQWIRPVLGDYFRALYAAFPEGYAQEAVAAVREGLRLGATAEVEAVAALTPVLYTTLLLQQRADDMETLHAQFRAAFRGREHTASAAEEASAFASARLNLLEKTNVEAFIQEGLPAAMRITGAATWTEAREPAELAWRLYEPLLRARRWEEAETLQRCLHTAFARIPNGASYQKRDVTTFTQQAEKALFAARTLEDREQIRQLLAEAWSRDAAVAVPLALPLMRKLLLREPALLGWIYTFGRLAEALPAAHPQRAAAYLVLGQCYQTLGLASSTPADEAQEYADVAAKAYALVLAQYPTTPDALAALTSLAALYRSGQRTEDLKALLASVSTEQAPVALQAWAADYAFHEGTPAGYAQAARLYPRLAARAPTDARCALWSYRTARSLDLLQRPADAVAAYDLVVRRFPETSVARIAADRLQTLKGAR